MPQRKLTATSVDKLKAPEAGRVEYFDTILTGFALRITSNNHRSWVLFYRIGGRQRRLTIGSYPLFSLADAREEARQALQLVEKGNDPAEVRAAAKRSLANPDTMEAVIEDFIEKYSKPNNKTWEQVQRIFNLNVLPYWGKRDIKSITKRDVLEIIDMVSERASPVRANRVLAHIRKLFNWAIDRDLIVISPVSTIKPPGKERERERFLSEGEIKSVWTGCDQLGWPFGPFTQMLLITAQRRDEVSHMMWEHIDFENSVWTIPREMTKADRTHEVPLSQLALSILEKAPRIGPYVFMSGRKENRPISGFGKAKKRLDEASQTTDWRYHDLRRTAGTNMARMGIPISTISRILNHAEGGVTKIYARHSYLEEKRMALDEWAISLLKIL
jgi:integrase